MPGGGVEDLIAAVAFADNRREMADPPMYDRRHRHAVAGIAEYWDESRVRPFRQRGDLGEADAFRAIGPHPVQEFDLRRAHMSGQQQHLQRDRPAVVEIF